MWIENLSWRNKDHLFANESRELDDLDITDPSIMRAIVVYLLREIVDLENKIRKINDKEKL